MGPRRRQRQPWRAGPTDTAIQALVELNQDDVKALTAAYSWTVTPADPASALDAGLRPFLPSPSTRPRYAAHVEERILI